jgi:hypothetical protein
MMLRQDAACFLFVAVLALAVCAAAQDVLAAETVQIEGSNQRELKQFGGSMSASQAQAQAQSGAGMLALCSSAAQHGSIFCSYGTVSVEL